MMELFCYHRFVVARKTIWTRSFGQPEIIPTVAGSWREFLQGPLIVGPLSPWSAGPML